MNRRQQEKKSKQNVQGLFYREFKKRGYICKPQRIHLSTFTTDDSVNIVGRHHHKAIVISLIAKEGNDGETKE